MKLIPLTRGLFAKIDDSDFEWLSSRKWYISTGGHGYLYAGSSASHTKRTDLMHRIIMNAPHGMEVDHINHDTLDNQRHNLRLCTHNENAYNNLRKTKSYSGYKGVILCKDNRKLKWLSRIMFNRKGIFLGRFSTPEEAALVYDAKARELFGEFARCNFEKE